MDHIFSDWNNPKLCKFCRFATFFNSILLIFRICSVQWLNCTNIKDELNHSYNGGGVVYLRKSEASHSSIQYVQILKILSIGTNSTQKDYSNYMELILIRYLNSIDKYDKVLDLHIRVGFQLRKNASNLERLTMNKIVILLRITLNFTKEVFYGVTGFFMV